MKSKHGYSLNYTKKEQLKIIVHDVVFLTRNRIYFYFDKLSK